MEQDYEECCKGDMRLKGHTDHYDQADEQMWFGDERTFYPHTEEKAEIL